MMKLYRIRQTHFIRNGKQMSALSNPAYIKEEYLRTLIDRGLADCDPNIIITSQESASNLFAGRRMGSDMELCLAERINLVTATSKLPVVAYLYNPNVISRSDLEQAILDGNAGRDPRFIVTTPGRLDVLVNKTTTYETPHFYEALQTNDQSICIKGLRRPSLLEATLFLTAEDKREETVLEIMELKDQEAKSAFYMKQEAQWPVFSGKSNADFRDEKERRRLAVAAYKTILGLLGRTPKGKGYIWAENGKLLGRSLSHISGIAALLRSMGIVTVIRSCTLEPAGEGRRDGELPLVCFSLTLV